MRICDLCKTYTAVYDRYIQIDKKGNSRNFELCNICYQTLRQKERYHTYLAYEETVKEMTEITGKTGDSVKKKSWFNLFNKENRPC